MQHKNPNSDAIFHIFRNFSSQGGKFDAKKLNDLEGPIGDFYFYPISEALFSFYKLGPITHSLVREKLDFIYRKNRPDMDNLAFDLLVNLLIIFTSGHTSGHTSFHTMVSLLEKHLLAGKSVCVPNKQNPTKDSLNLALFANLYMENEGFRRVMLDYSMQLGKNMQFNEESYGKACATVVEEVFSAIGKACSPSNIIFSGVGNPVLTIGYYAVNRPTPLLPDCMKKLAHEEGQPKIKIEVVSTILVGAAMVFKMQTSPRTKLYIVTRTLKVIDNIVHAFINNPPPHIVENWCYRTIPLKKDVEFFSEESAKVWDDIKYDTNVYISPKVFHEFVAQFLFEFETIITKQSAARESEKTDAQISL